VFGRNAEEGGHDLSAAKIFYINCLIITYKTAQPNSKSYQAMVTAASRGKRSDKVIAHNTRDVLNIALNRRVFKKPNIASKCLHETTFIYSINPIQPYRLLVLYYGY